MRKSCGIVIYIILTVMNFTSCTDNSEIENKRILTACIITSDNNLIKYKFLVSIPYGKTSGGESGSESSSKIYEFESENFQDAINSFEESGLGEIDASHMSLFAADKNYYDKYYIMDEESVRKTIPASSLVSVCIVNCDDNIMIESIQNEYESKADKFSDNLFNNNLLICDMNLSKLSLACHNKFYSVKIPIIDFKMHNEIYLPQIYSFAVFSTENGVCTLKREEYEALNNWIKSGRMESININKTSCIINNIGDKQIVDILSKYADKDIDILNIKYAAKKEFLFYDDYTEYFEDYKMSNMVFKE